jgi:hypothetical protein
MQEQHIDCEPRNKYTSKPYYSRYGVPSVVVLTVEGSDQGYTGCLLLYSTLCNERTLAAYYQAQNTFITPLKSIAGLLSAIQPVTCPVKASLDRGCEATPGVDSL